MLKVIKSKNLANFLIKEGLVCRKIDNDRENRNYLIFLFEQNEELNNAMKKWQETYINNKIK